MEAEGIERYAEWYYYSLSDKWSSQLSGTVDIRLTQPHCGNSLGYGACWAVEGRSVDDGKMVRGL